MILTDDDNDGDVDDNDDNSGQQEGIFVVRRKRIYTLTSGSLP